MSPPAPAALLDEGSGPALLLFHGWSGSSRNLLRWLPALAPRFRVIAPSLPGCDGVPPLAERHDAAAYARVGIAVLDGLGIDEAFVGGLCSGSAIALALAARAPERARGLLLHTPFLRRELLRPLIRAQLALLGSPAGVLFGPVRASPLAHLHRRVFANGAEVSAAQRGADQADLVRADSRAARELAHDLLHGDRTATLRAWRRPVGVVVADDDAFVDAPAVVRAVRACAPQAAVETIPGGHGWTDAYVAAQHVALARLAAALLGL